MADHENFKIIDGKKVPVYKAKVVERKQLNIGRHVYTVVKLESNENACCSVGNITRRSFKSKIHTRVLTAIYSSDWLTF